MSGVIPEAQNAGRFSRRNQPQQGMGIVQQFDGVVLLAEDFVGFVED